MSEKGPAKITVTWDDLKSRKVEARLKEQDALARTRAYSQMGAEHVPAPPQAYASAGGTSFWRNLWYNSLVYMAVFGLVGGLLAGGLGLLLQFKPSDRVRAAELMSAIRQVRQEQERGRFRQADADAAIEEIRWSGRRNPYFVTTTDPNLSPEDRDARLRKLAADDQMRTFIANVLSFGLSGMILAVCLAVAEPVVDRNWPAAVINGSVGASLGLIGGLVVALFHDRLFVALGGTTGESMTTARQVLARSATWGVLGLFLTLAPGSVMRNLKKLAIGLAGGLIGGLIGGALWDGLARWTHNPDLSRLLALLAIGVVAGVGTGAIENAAKSGWLRVIAGLIAGKQFILYRNPTYIGSGPDCQIYLFKDPQVGRRHAALHLVPGGFEVEDLPLGAATLVNDRPVKRTRLRNGDRLSIGSTVFLFQEKEKPAAAQG